MSKKFLAGISLGLGIPLVAGGVMFGVPTIRNKIIPTGDDSELSSRIEVLEKENKDLKDENTSLKQNNGTFESRIQSLNSELVTAKSSIEQKDVAIADKEKQIEALLSEKANLQSELDTYKELAGSDINYVDLIASLQSNLDEKTTALNSANAELEQLKLDKSSLETRVAELETELAEVKEELANYKNLDTEIDTLNIESYEGTWYKDGTFEDYYTIENGVVTHNADEDKGLLNSIYNQMYLMMNTAGGKAVTLSDDGMTFETVDGDVYSKYYINTEETVTPNYMFCGTYSNDSTQIKLNADNTTTMTVGETTYTGAYLATTKQKNIGGNITRYNTITATYQTADGAIVKVFENTSRDNLLSDGDVGYFKTANLFGAILSGDTDDFSPEEMDYGYKIVFKTYDFIKILPGKALSIKFFGTEGSWSGGFYLNSISKSFGSIGYISLYNRTEKTIYSNIFEFYFKPFGYAWNSCKISDIIAFGGIEGNVVSVEKFGEFSETTYPLYGYLADFNDDFSSITCSSVVDYTNGTYSDETNTIILSEDTATINDITATTYDISATTDGTDIYQTVTLTYITTDEEVETTHTVILTFKNKELQTTKLDDEDLSLSRK